MRKCEDYKQWLPDLYTGRLADAEKAELEQHLGTCADCRMALAATQLVLDSISSLQDPEPSAEMKVNFRAMLDDFKATEKEPAANSFWMRFKRSWALQPRFPLAYGLLILLIGIGLIYWNHNKQQEAAVQQQTAMLHLLDNPLASERIKAINYTGEMKQANQQVITALLAILNNDPNDNVRLSTLEALAQLAGDPEVRIGLIQSIPKQDSPVVQIAIAGVMLKLQEKRSVGPLKELLKQPDLDGEVKDQVQKTITKLI